MVIFFRTRRAETNGDGISRYLIVLLRIFFLPVLEGRSQFAIRTLGRIDKENPIVNCIGGVGAVVDTVNCFENIRSVFTQEIPGFFRSDVIDYQQLIANFQGIQSAVNMVRVVL